MAEYCVECWNKINNETHSKYEYVTTMELCLCEGCGEYKHIIIKEATVIDWLLHPLFWIINVCYIGCALLIDFFQNKKK